MSGGIIIETKHSIYEYDTECIECSDFINTFVLLMCIKYADI